MGWKKLALNDHGFYLGRANGFSFEMDQTLICAVQWNWHGEIGCYLEIAHVR
jgi:hypothetical protein